MAHRPWRLLQADRSDYARRSKEPGQWRRLSMLSDHPVFPILLSTDLDASRTFYRDKLGLELIREDEGDRLVFRCGAGTQIAVTKSTVGTSDTQTQMAWRGGAIPPA